jgi:zinc protease
MRRTHVKTRLALLAIFLCLVPVVVQAQSAASAAREELSRGIQTRTLKNGMKVIVWPDHDIPNVALFNWFRVGSRNEYPGITGLSHFFEHMMFNGAKKYGPGEFDRVMEANGGRNNAYTTENVTVYQDWFPRTALDLIFDLEADRIRDLSFDPKVIESERGVVYSERRSSVDNNNVGLLAEQVQATAFVAHPYQFPVIGWPSDIESWKHEDLVRYFKTYYSPNNATLIVVGDVTPAEIFSLSEKYIESIPNGPAAEPIRTREPEQLGERRVHLSKLAQVPLVQMAYHIGPANEPEGEALDLLVAILSDGESSRLHRRLVEEERVAIDAAGFRDRGFDPSLAWFFITVSPDADPARVEKLLTEELDKVIAAGPTDAELRKVKNIAVANFWRGLKTISGKAQVLGTYEVFYGDYKKLFTAPDRYEAVTRQQIQNAAKKYFRATNRTVGVLLPQAEQAEAQEKEPGQ